MKTILIGAVVTILAGVFAAQAEETIFAAVKGDLVQSKGKKLEAFDEAPLANAKYYAIYYSAGWCAPCRAFTPDLVKWYKRNKSKHPDFELIFVSSDRSEEDMAKYMKEDDMPWPALAYSKKGSNRELTKYAGPGIPCLVFLDDSGKVLANSYEGGTYVGPRKVLEQMDKTLRSHPAAGGQKAGGSNFEDFFKKKPAQ
jgi:nucleoredoxin